jgi:3-methyladenine DNA glycosylase AlkD
MKTNDVMKALEKMGSAQTKKTWMRHGCAEPLFGVKIADMKVLIKKLKLQNNTALGKELYETGNGDAMYLAGLICDGREFTRRELQSWAKKACWRMLSSYTVPWVASENPEGWDLALEWIESTEDKISLTGWMTLAGIASIREDKELDLPAVEQLLDRIAKTIHQAPNQTRGAMNGFLITVGGAVKPLTKKAQAAAAKVGAVEVDMGDTACKVPLATDYIQKVLDSGRQGAKRKSIRC